MVCLEFCNKEEEMPKQFHYNFIVLGKMDCPYTLLNEAIFPTIMHLAEPVVGGFSKDGKVTAVQLVREDPGDSHFKNAKNGRLRWSEKSLRPVLEKQHQYPPGDVLFISLAAEFPSIAVADKQGRSCEAYLRIGNDEPHGRPRSDGDCGLLLSLREDIWRGSGADAARQFLGGICRLVREAKVLFRKRPFLAKADIGYNSLQDIIFSHFRNPALNPLYSGWKECEAADGVY